MLTGLDGLALLNLCSLLVSLDNAASPRYRSLSKNKKYKKVAKVDVSPMVRMVTQHCALAVAALEKKLEEDACVGVSGATSPSF